MGLIAIQRIARNSSLNPIVYTTADAGGTDEIPATPGLTVIWRNASGGALPVTMVSVPCSHSRSQDEVASIGASADAAFNPNPDPGIWKQADGNIDFTHGGSASLSVAAIIYE
jgi:hypothetical protein